MKITLDQLEQIFAAHGDSLGLTYFDDVVVRGTAFLATDIILPDHLRPLREGGLTEVEVLYTPPIYQILHQAFEASFRSPSGRLSYTALDRHLEELRGVGTQTRRKRFIHLVGDIYGIDTVKGKRHIVLHHNEPLDYYKWNSVKRQIDKEQVFLYRNSEVQIIVYVNMTVKTGPAYVERFRINTDLISLLVSRRDGQETPIAPDYVGTEDVTSVTDPASLLTEYIRTNARLIIIGEKLVESDKIALMEVKKYDKFVRMLVVPVLDQRNQDHFLRQVRLVYNSNRW